MSVDWKDLEPRNLTDDARQRAERAGVTLARSLRMLLRRWAMNQGECGCGGCEECYAYRVLAHVDGKSHGHGPKDDLPPEATCDV